MGTMSYIFFGLMLIPLLAFLIWVIKQDKKKNYIGLGLLVVGIVIATYTILKLDKNFMEDKGQVAPKASSFR
jgi:uncharacterized membrane protein YqjE